jgi:DNA-binding NarL/FixJ family response regulator
MTAPRLLENGAPPRVAILEDHYLVREALVGVLERAGVPVVGQFEDGDSFLLGVRNLSPDIALIDLTLERRDSVSGLDGLAVLRALPGVSPTTRAVVLSAVRNRRALEEARALGARAYLQKLDASQERVLSTLAAVSRGDNLLGLENESPISIGTDDLDDLLLTPRERHVLACLATGADNLKIAAMLGITERTVRAHVSSLYRKLQRENRAELALLGRDLVQPVSE